ncbi:MAG: fibronectin type III domain-containing protein [Thermomicrobiales bacterium]
MKYQAAKSLGRTLLPVIVIAAAFLAPPHVFAGAYGSGTYGANNYQTNNPVAQIIAAVTTLFSGGASPTTCSLPTPGTKAPWLYAAIANDGNSATLYFTDASGSYDHYALTYGFSSGSDQFGADNIGGRGMRTYRVTALAPNTTYVFKVRAGNGCAPGSWSNELSVTTKSLVSRDDLRLSQQGIATGKKASNQTPACAAVYTVRSGDTLSRIAQEALGDSSHYPLLVALNKATYRSLASSTTLRVGWKLTLPCKGKEQPKPVAGYDVNIAVRDATNKPVAGATVTLHSVPQTATTDGRGIAMFHDVERGQHHVAIAYGVYRGEESALGHMMLHGYWQSDRQATILLHST